jgi:hypothetical protein
MKRSYAVEDEEEGEGTQRSDSGGDKGGRREVRFGLRFLFPEHEEPQVQGVQRKAQIFKQVYFLVSG